MSYWSEALKLAQETRRQLDALMEPYKDYRNPSMLDGEPWAEEERNIMKAFSAGLKDLWKKYPDWKSEEEPKNIQNLLGKE